MTPTVPAVLAELANVITRSAAPDVADAERASNLGLAAMLLNVAAEVWDGAAENLVQENRTLRTLLGLEGCDDDLRLSALKTANDRLRASLIEAQVTAEEAGDTERQAAIWAELRASTERRKLSISLV
ncbi:MAG: hypothetical protein JWQ52_72 [Phenylobacterium sp.]|jgi:hypothetical protein|nr:hypothetical protein [Phenylobacterium sp.]